jgi:murein DD-endopeptidase MepM/ murein hydrolase activator NlpD
VEDAASLAADLALYTYTPRSDDTIDDTIRSLAARCNIPQAAIVTLNRLEQPESPGNQPLLLPTMPGIFIPETPESELERLIYASRTGVPGVTVTVFRQGAGGMTVAERFLFIPGDDFSPSERAFFLNPEIWRFPLKEFTLTDRFGLRVNPVTGLTGMHAGLDLAAPLGSDVYPARAGTVAAIDEDVIYGKYVIITHDNGWTSLYGHLSAIMVGLHSAVNSGTLIGKVGSTGQSTGPHLHFELRQNGVAEDPWGLLSNK